MLSSALFTWPAGHVVTALELNEAVAALNGSADVAVINLANPTPNPAAISGTVLSQSGNLNGAYQWVMTETVGLVDGNGNLHPGGQTAMGTPSNLVNPSNNPVALTVPAPSARSVSRTIWRTQAGGTTFYFLVTLTNPQVSTWIDDVADADLGTETAPTVNNTGTVLSLPVFDSVPAFSVEAGTLIAVTNADNATTLYRSDGSGWLALPDLAVANTWTALQTLSSGIAVPSGAVLTNSGTYAGTPLVTGLTAGTGISVTNPTSPGTAAVAVNNAPNSALAGPLVTGLTAGTGISVTNPTGVGTATVDVVLSGTTLINSGGVAINLANANTWTGAQTFESATLTGTTTNAGTISGGTVDPASGTVAGDWTVNGFLHGNNYGTIFGNFNGSVSGNSFTTTVFGSDPAGFGVGWNANQGSGDTDLFAMASAHSNTSGTFRFFANVSPSSPTTMQQIGSWDAGGNLSVAGLATFNAGITGTGTLGALTAGTGLLETANTWQAEQTMPDLAVTGLTGATTAMRLVGGTTSGAPTTGTFQTNDVVVDAGKNTLWLCQSGGSPGVWTNIGTLASTGAPVTLATANTSTSILSYTPTQAGLYTVRVYLNVITAATDVLLGVQWTDAQGTQMFYWVNTYNSGTALAVGPYTFTAQTVYSVAASPITVIAGAGTANQVIVSAEID